MTTPDTDRAELEVPDVDAAAIEDEPPGSLAEMRSADGGRPGAEATGRSLGPPGRRRRLAVVAGAVAAGALVAFLVVSGVQAKHQTRRSEAAVAVVRAH